MYSITYPEFLGRYRLRQKIGEGGYGQVFRVFDCETKSYMALKKIVLRRNEDPLTFLREIQIQAFLAHPLVLKIFEFYLYQAHDKHLGHKIEIGIISELGKMSLQKLIKDKTEIFPIEEIINFAFHFTKLFAFFQDQRIVHRDIKPDNFVQVGPGLTCKLIDFGLCTHVNDIRGVAGSFAYMSPKLKKMHTNKELKNHIKSNPYKDDVYSFGLTLYELITRQSPNSRIYESTQRFSSNIYHTTKQNQKLAQIVQLMLEYEEENRPDFNQLYEIFKKHFNFFEEDPFHQLEEYSEKDLERMAQLQRREVINKRHEYQKNKGQQYMQKLKFEKPNFRKGNKFQSIEEIQNSNDQEFQRKEVYYIDKEMEEEINRRKKRHFANEKVILSEEPTSYTRDRRQFQKEEEPKEQYYQKNQANYYNQQQREQQSSPQNFDDKTVEIDKTGQNQADNQGIFKQNLNSINQNQNLNETVEIPETVYQQVQEIQNTQQKIQNQQQQAQQQNNVQFDKKHYCLPTNIEIISIIMMKDFIICGCKDGSLRIMNTKSKTHRNIYRIVGSSQSHEGSPIIIITKDKLGRLWTASEDGKVIMWDRMKFFTRLMNEAHYDEEIVEIENRMGQNQLVSLGVLHMDPEASHMKNLYEKFRPGITALYCHDEKNFVIGYNDGSVLAIWKNLDLTYRLQFEAISCIKFHNQEIYTASLDGTIKILDLKKLVIRENTFKCFSGIRNFQVSGNVETPQFFVATIDGRGYKINTETGQWEVPEDVTHFEPIDIKDSFFADDESAVLLTSNGKILRNGNPMVDLVEGQSESDGWCCMSWDSNVSIAIGNSKGHICLISAV